jgi:hypothetical protein
VSNFEYSIFVDGFLVGRCSGKNQNKYSKFNQLPRTFIHLLRIAYDLLVLHGLRPPRKSFFLKHFELLGLGRHFGMKCFKEFGVFSAELSAHILVM